MEKLTYQQAYNKIIDAYYKDEINPFNEEFCFCGTLSPNSNWSRSPYFKTPILEYYPYSKEEYGRMEKALFSKLKKCRWQKIGLVDYPSENPFTEDELFAGMSAALDVLKQIHIERGEVIDEEPVFIKRQLVTAK